MNSKIYRIKLNLDILLSKCSVCLYSCFSGYVSDAKRFGADYLPGKLEA